MQKTLLLNKPIGMTPLQSIEEYRSHHPELHNVKLAYAGRLDPMAQGLLLVLIGNECKNRTSYELLPKIYKFETVFGISTDTFDILGLLLRGQTSPKLNNLRNIQGLTSGVDQLLPTFLGKQIQYYPPYSSARVHGKPLYYWAREGKLDQIEIPHKEIEIYSLEHISNFEISVEKFVKTALERISQVQGKFRQEQIIPQWEEFRKLFQGHILFGAQFEITCSSGTYIRSIAYQMGEQLGTGALAFSIKRTHVGPYCLVE